jgi:hypothetical protein
MWGFFWLFWMVPVLLFALGMRRRRRRWGLMGPGGFGPCGAGRLRGRGDWADSRTAGDAPGLRRGVEDQQAYVDSLESRIAQLEERLDFTERLLSGRRDSQGGS